MKVYSFSLRNLAFLLLTSIVIAGASACDAAATQPSDVSTAVAPPPATATPEFLIPETGGGSEAAPALLETRRLTLEYPTSIKAGSGSEVIRLTLEVDALGNITPTALVDGNVVEGEVIQIPNLYATHNVTAEAYFDVAGLEVVPPGATFQPLKQGESVAFYWSVRSDTPATYGGVIHLFLNFENRDTGEKERKEISAQIIDIKVVDFFGFSTNFVKTSGVVGSVLGSVIGFPFFKDIAIYLFGRLTKPKKKPAKPKKKT